MSGLNHCRPESFPSEGSRGLGRVQVGRTVRPLGLTTELCLPIDVEKFLYIAPCEPWSENCWKALKPLSDPWEREILKAINNLSNTVIQNQASRTLSCFTNKPHGRRTFQSIPLFYRVLHILGTQRFRLPVRRYVLDLFDIRLDPAVVTALHEFGQSRPPPQLRAEENKDATPQIAAPQPSATTSASTPEMRQTRSPGPPPTTLPVWPSFRLRRNTRIGAVSLGIAVPRIDGVAPGLPPETAVDPATYDYEAMERARNAALGQLHSAVEEPRLPRERGE
ncbi:hypothetical protein FRC10_004304 [Ceratobasidium sp. 414]|nr:hypothetical protein FRC10_004304 [Ceratobasidium sp. 414]